MDKLLEFFEYEKMEETTLFNVNLRNVEIKKLYSIEYKYKLSLFHNFTIPKIIIKDNIIEFYTSDKMKKNCDWYSLEDVYLFLYQIHKFDDDDDLLVLTRINYATDKHLLRNIVNFQYYSIKEISYKKCFCFRNSLCSNRHLNHMKSIQGYIFGYCTQYTLYDCTFKDKYYNTIQVCSDCSLLNVDDTIYNLYLSSKQKDDRLVDYEPKPFYEHFALGDEPGYWSNGGIADLEMISYKMGIEIVQTFQTNNGKMLKKGDGVFNYYFNYKTSEAEFSEKYGITRFYVHIGKKVSCN